MPYKPHVEFANFTCKFGPYLNLVNLLEEVVIPAMTDTAQVRATSRADYVIEDATLMNLGDGEDRRLCIVGRFVKDTTYERTHIRESGKVKRSERKMSAALLSLFVLVLDTHKLIFLHETRDAPGLQAFESTIEYFLRAKYEIFLRALRDSLVDTQGDKDKVNAALIARDLIPVKESDPGGQGDGVLSNAEAEALADKIEEETKTKRKVRADTLTHLRALVPKPSLMVVPLASESSLEDFIKSFDILSLVRITIGETNDERDYNPFFGEVRKNKTSIGAIRASLSYVNKEGLNKEDAIEQVKAVATQGQARTFVEGKDEYGREKSGDESKFKIKRTIADLANEDDTHERLRQLYGAFGEGVVEGTIKLQSVPTSTTEKLNKIKVPDVPKQDAED